MVNKIIDLISNARQNGIGISVNDDKLKLKVPRDTVIDEQLLEDIRCNKELIINFLNDDRWKSEKDEINDKYRISPFDRNAVQRVPLSYEQESLWFIDRLNGSTAYHMMRIFRLTGHLDVPALEQAVKRIITRHEILRTVIKEEDGIGYQEIQAADDWKMSYLTEDVLKSRDIPIHTFIENEIQTPFDLTKDYMLRLTLVRLSASEHIMISVIHHIAADGWSMSVLVKELVALYRNRENMDLVKLKPQALQYADYARWQRAYLSGPIMKTKMDYWRKQLSGVEPFTLPPDFHLPSFQHGEGGVVTRLVPRETGEALLLFSKRQGVTLFMTLLAAFKVLLYRYTGQEDICIGSPVAGRKQQSLEGVVGFFINALVLRSYMGGNPLFTELLERVKQTTLFAYEHQDVPLEKIVTLLDLPRDASRIGGFPVRFALQNAPEAELMDLNGVGLAPVLMDETLAQVDVNLDVSETIQGLNLILVYRRRLYRPEMMKQLLDHYVNLLYAILKQPSARICELSLLMEHERQLLLYGFNHTATDYPENKTVIDLFEQQAASTPDAIAVTSGEKSMSYRTLNERADQVAHYLRERDIGEEDLVPVCTDRGLSTMVAILGILKAGAAYVPVDPAYPPERIAYILENTGAPLILSNTGCQALDKQVEEGIVVFLDDDWHKTQPVSEIPFTRRLAAGQLAYTIYTSGTTGRPKGVMVTHGSLLNISLAWRRHYLLDVHTPISLSLASIAFDVFTGDWCRTLLNGGTLVIVSEEKKLNLAYLYATMVKQQVNIFESTPSLIYQLVTYAASFGLEFPFLRLLIVGSDICTPETYNYLRQHYGKNIRIVNSYGVTEAAIDSSYFEGELGDRAIVPIGKPLDNIRYYILDEYRQPVPIGVLGELCIGGAGVGRGYINEPELNNRKFVPDPFAEDNSNMYCTGDKARWLENGMVELWGRNDDQVKVRGYRIELGEIEAVLQHAPGVKEGVVLAKEDDDGLKRLVAYIVPYGSFDKERVVAYLRTKLTEYMIPAVFTELTEIPLTFNGKVDRKSLTKMKLTMEVSNVYAAPTNEQEAKLAGIWKELLGVKRVGIHDNFFELGGHSLLVMRVVAAVRKHLNKDMQVRDIFSYPTVAELSAQLSGEEYDILPEDIDQPATELPMYEVSYAQRRLWLQDQFEELGNLYNMDFSYEMEDIDVKALEIAFMALITRHESFRTTISQVEGEPKQFIHPVSHFAPWITFEDIRDVPDVAATVKQKTAELTTRYYNLATGPLVRALLLRITDSRYRFLVSMHHIISDGYSMQLMEKEFKQFYALAATRGEVDVPPLTLQYKDYALWQRKRIENGELDKSSSYWLNHLAGISPGTNLCAERPRPLKRTYDGGTASCRFPDSLRNSLFKMCQKEGTSMFMGLLSIIKILIYRYTGQEDQVLGTVVAGRTQLELETQIGFYVNTLALRTTIDGNMSFTGILRRVRETLLDAYTHQEYPFDLLVEKLDLPRDLSRHPVFDLMVNYDVVGTLQQPGQINGSQELYDVKVKEEGVSKNDMSFTFNESNGGLYLIIEYATALYPAAWMERFTHHFMQLAKMLLETPDVPVAEIDYLSAVERELLLHQLNDTYKDFDRQTTLVSLFRKQVAISPDAEALQMGNEVFSYRELDDITDRLATYLINTAAITPGAITGIMTTRSTWTVIGIIAILKTGGAYLPIDPAYPAERIRYIMDNARTAVVLSNNPLNWPANTSARLISLNAALSATLREITTINAAVPVNAEDLAYVIYTSGSTGQPKGVKITHRAVVNFCGWLQSLIYENREPLRCMLTAPVSFDASVQQLFPPLIYGSKLVLISEEDRKDTRMYAGKIAEHRIDVLDCTPGYLEVVMESLAAIKDSLPVLTTLVGGEALKKGTVEQYYDLFPPGSRLINVYGLTEATVDSTFEITAPGAAVPSIGTPVHNTEVYILDKQQHLLPLAVAGEIAISGEGLAAGYLYDETKTAQKFVPHPYRKDARLFLTGDLGYWRMDGKMMFIGRKDNQIKLRGFRIELGEIEASIAVIPGIDLCCVKLYQHAGTADFLVAYYSGSRQEDARLAGELRKVLPEYMVPSFFVYMDPLPLTVNGKVDRNKLPQRYSTQVEEKVYVNPGTPTEELLMETWKEVLGKRQLSIHDNFFEMGGHSLKAMQMIARIYKNMAVELELRDIFNYPSIATLARQLDEKKIRGRQAGIPVIPEAAYYDVSFAQRRLWIIDQFDNAGHAYNMYSTYELKDVQLPALQLAFNMVLQRHEILRTTIKLIEGEPRQQVHSLEDLDIRIIEEDVRDIDFAGKEGNELIARKDAENFDLEKGPLVRCYLFRVSERDYTLFTGMHHVITDGWSMVAFKEELLDFYNQYCAGTVPAPPPLAFQYRDFASWQRKRLADRELDNSRIYWSNVLSGERPVLDLLPGKSRPETRTFDGAEVSIRFPYSLRKKITQYCQTNGITLFMGVISVLKVLFSRYTGLDDIIIGTAAAGREHPQLEDKIGFYVNTLVLRTRLNSRNSDFNAVVARVKETILGAYQHQDYPFDILLDDLGLEWERGRNPLFDIMATMNVDYDNTADPSIVYVKEEEERLSTSATVVSKFDMNFNFIDNDEELHLGLIYNKSLFTGMIAERILHHYLSLADQLFSTPDAETGNVCFMDAAEQRLLLQELNGNRYPAGSHVNVAAWFGEQVISTPDAVAVCTDERSYTYLELNQAANAVAVYLQTQCGVTGQEVVAVSAGRSFELIAGMLGILKTGAIYLPIDTSIPEERAAFMLTEAKVNWLLTSGAPEYHFPATRSVSLPGILSNMKEEIQFIPQETGVSADVAYVIFTSGSSGTPKGVMISHGSLINLCQWHQRTFNIQPDSRTTLYAGIGFDASVWEMWPYLLAGAGIYIMPDAAREREDLLAAFVREQGITHMFLPTAVYERFADGNVLPDHLTVLTGGEALKKRGQGGWKLYNCYGPTEGTVVTTCAGIKPDTQTIAIGKPIDNVNVYILDERQQLLPYGCKGELYIGGAGVACGYLNDEKLTQEHFVTGLPWNPGERLYRTGDWVYWNGDGQLMFAGRKDQQVKIRGFRVELGEIESAIMHTGKVTQVVVQLTGTGSDAFLAAWYEGDVQSDELQEMLRRHLPVYMIPSHLIKVDGLLLNANGKIDRRKLVWQAPETVTGRRVMIPETRLEMELHKIWKVLFPERDAISTDDNFFEVGGHSLKAMQLVNHIYRQLNIAVTFRDIFGHPDIRSLAAFISSQAKQEGATAREDVLLPMGDLREGLPTIFLIPPIFGSATVYSQLAQSISQQANTYGLHYPGLFGGQSFPEDLPAIARIFTDSILEVHSKEENVYLLGYSMGAWIAFETARLLEEQGLTVILLLLDKPVTHQVQEGYLSDEDLAAGFAYEIANWESLFSASQLDHLQKMYKHNFRVHEKHVIAGTVNADIFTIQCSGQMANTEGMTGWKEHTRGLVSSFDINATHHEVLNKENLPRLVKIIKYAFVS